MENNIFQINPIFFKQLIKKQRHLLSERGTEMMTPLPVPIQSRFDEIRSAVMRMREKPNLPVPEKQFLSANATK
jgi:hypothetical protein